MTFAGTNFKDKNVQEFLEKVHRIIVEDALIKGTDRAEKLMDFKLPEEMKVGLWLYKIK